MTPGFAIRLYLLTVPVFFLIDMLWLGVVARDFYQYHLGHWLADEVNWVAAVCFYLFYIVGILVFAVMPALETGSLRRAAMLGGFFGLITYATYDLTNLATLRDWPLIVVFVDITWGGVLCALVATASYLIGRRSFAS